MHAALSDRGANMAGLGISQCAPLGGRSNILTRRPGIIKPRFGATELKLNHPLARGLVGRWLFNEGSGITAYDASGEGNNGALMNMSSPPIPTSGWQSDGGALAFDGSNDVVRVNHSLSLIPPYLTLLFWAYHNNATRSFDGGVGKGDIFGSYATSSYRLEFHLGAAIFMLDDGDGVSSLTTTGSSVVSVGWNQWVGRYNGSEVRLYKNGNSIGSSNGAKNIAWGTFALGIGGRPNGTYPIDGLISSVSIYNRALSAAEIAYLYAFPYCMFR